MAFKESVKEKRVNISDDFMVSQLDVVNLRFKGKFEDLHRNLKASIHKCQMNAYAKPGLSLEKSE